MLSAIDRKYCPPSIGTAVRLRRNPQGARCALFRGFVAAASLKPVERVELGVEQRLLFRGFADATSLKFENLIEVELLQAMSSGALLQN